MTAIRQIEKLGFKPSDVKHIILTHLDFDHAGGLDDFPGASVHLSQIEKKICLATKKLGWTDNVFVPASGVLKNIGRFMIRLGVLSGTGFKMQEP